MLNRSASVVKPRQPFLDWLHTANPTSQNLMLGELALEPTIYLVPVCDTEGGVHRVLRELCEEIFVEQLAAELSKCRRCGGLYCGREDCSSLCLCSIVRSFSVAAGLWRLLGTQTFPRPGRHVPGRSQGREHDEIRVSESRNVYSPSYDLIGRTWDEALSGCAQRQVRNADLEFLVSGA
jgi:hypothetical protein